MQSDCGRSRLAPLRGNFKSLTFQCFYVSQILPQCEAVTGITQVRACLLSRCTPGYFSAAILWQNSSKYNSSESNRQEI